ncbi:Putative hydroxypyruvate reductase [Bradyrhizobium ivorense]|uniref:Hydroxypyruvate reductase n=1 Tax=Bradyrhizobium ivorense TaxID=2511166 RepID=A0A508TGL9_9BRAD|nr:glycerate kinase [Bradyrhizobium ivorense]VIO73492.1 Putative hydroxypyruvate reductase [Bradyrhizobium ivorense]
MTDRRPLLRSIFDAAVAAAHPDVVLASRLRPVPKGRIICLAAGKGAGAMAAAAERHYLDALGLAPSRLVGIATTRHGHGVPTRRIKVVEAGHPVPDEAGLRAADDTLRLATEATPDDLLLVLLTGGGSANWIAPVEGMTFAQKQQVNRALLRSGAPIGEVNTVRKHLSRIKGGRLARAGQRAAEIVTLAISDVPHDDPSAIASGPTVPDTTTLGDAGALVARYNLSIDDAVRRALDDPGNESCKPGDSAFARATFELLAKPKASIDAAVKVAHDAGYETIALGADLEGEARDVAAAHAQLALKARSEGRRVAILSGGELTVTVRGNGRGGPNQEYALALAGLLKDTPDISALAADTDGADGGAGSATDPAGAMIDETTFAKMQSLGLDPKAYLANNDATGFFAQTGDLLLTGPTLTNVNDVRVILVD